MAGGEDITLQQHIYNMKRYSLYYINITHYFEAVDAPREFLTKI